METDTYNYPQDNHYQTQLLFLRLKLFQKINLFKIILTVQISKDQADL